MDARERNKINRRDKKNRKNQFGMQVNARRFVEMLANLRKKRAGEK